MLTTDLCIIGSNLQAVRKRTQMTQWDVAEIAGISSRTYADIERGAVCPRIDTLIKICQALHITPDDILLSADFPLRERMNAIFSKLDRLSADDQIFVLKMVDLYIKTASTS